MYCFNVETNDKFFIYYHLLFIISFIINHFLDINHLLSVLLSFSIKIFIIFYNFISSNYYRILYFV